MIPWLDPISLLIRNEEVHCKKHLVLSIPGSSFAPVSNLDGSETLLQLVLSIIWLRTVHSLVGSNLSHNWLSVLSGSIASLVGSN